MTRPPMPLAPILRRTLWLALLIVTSACDGDGPTITPPVVGGLIPVADGTWYLHTADDAPLPTRISDRFVGVTQEEVFLDSARITIDNLTGSYQQRYWVRVNHTGIQDRKEFVYDEGSFELGSGAFIFNSTARARTFTIATPNETELHSLEPMQFYAGASATEGVYRRTRPTAP